MLMSIDRYSENSLNIIEIGGYNEDVKSDLSEDSSQQLSLEDSYAFQRFPSMFPSDSYLQECHKNYTTKNYIRSKQERIYSYSNPSNPITQTEVKLHSNLPIQRKAFIQRKGSSISQFEHENFINNLINNCPKSSHKEPSEKREKKVKDVIYLDSDDSDDESPFERKNSKKVSLLIPTHDSSITFIRDHDDIDSESDLEEPHLYKHQTNPEIQHYQEPQQSDRIRNKLKIFNLLNQVMDKIDKEQVSQQQICNQQDSDSSKNQTSENSFTRNRVISVPNQQINYQ